MTFIEDTQILQVLRGFNPWWATGRVPPDLARVVRRVAFYEITRLLQQTRFRRAIMLSGARRVGKTTILYQLAQEAMEEGYRPHEVLYVSFDHPILKLTPLDRILEVFRVNIAAGSANVLLLLDEIHYAQDWSVWLKLTVDRNPRYRVVATGSASSVLGIEGTESGVGRWVDVKIPTLSFYEYAELLELERPRFPADLTPAQLPELPAAEANRVLSQCLPLEPHLHRYLMLGGFPEMVQVGEVVTAQRLLREDVVEKVLKRDMTALYGIRNVLDLERIFVYLCLHSGQIIAQEVIAREIGVSRMTVANDLKCLELANLIYRSDPVMIGGKRILKARPKIYLADTAIRNAVLLKGEEVLTDSTEMGIMVETAVFRHLFAYYYRERPRIGYWRDTRTGKEVDIVVSFPGRKHLAVEVKYREAPGIGPQDGISTLGGNGDAVRAFVITKLPRDFGPVGLKTPPPNRTAPFMVPAFAFLYLLGHAERASVSV